MPPPIPPPTLDDLHAWAWELGVDAGRRLADECDASVAVIAGLSDVAGALAIYGRAYLRGLIQGFRRRLQQHHAERLDLQRSRVDRARPAARE